MNVKLLVTTPLAREILIFTKQTRLNMDAAQFDKVCAMSDAEKEAELAYMANTIPSSWEFVDFTFAITGVSRGFTHQFVRTRTNSYAQQSMRVTDMSGFDYITGPSIKTDQQHSLYDGIMRDINTRYNEMIQCGVEIEDARGALPTNISTNIVAKVNLRTLSDMARSRTGGRTQSEYRQVMDAMINEVLNQHPWAEVFLFPKGRDFFDEVEQFARELEHPSLKTGLLKIIDKMRKAL